MICEAYVKAIHVGYDPFDPLEEFEVELVRKDGAEGTFWMKRDVAMKLLGRDMYEPIRVEIQDEMATVVD